MMIVMKLGVVSAIILLSFAGIALFGFTSMGHAEGNEHMGCIAAASQGGGCPQSREFDFAVFHLEAFKSFSSSIVAENFSSSLSFLALFFSAVLLFVSSAALSGFLRPNFYFQRSGFHSPAYFSKKALTRWLALHEASPQFFS